jgi:5-(aminomethyl)-3-furanmethanol phosphate kinase
VNPLIVKIGGSLYDWPELGPTLARWLEAQHTSDLRIVPGGGPFAEIIRHTDAIHHLGDESAHWLAIRAIAFAGNFLGHLCPPIREHLIDPVKFCRDDERRPGALPHTWGVTSDSISARAAEVLGGDLILLKSADPPLGDVTAWAAAGYVDRYFPTIVNRAKLFVRAINLRTA